MVVFFWEGLIIFITLCHPQEYRRKRSWGRDEVNKNIYRPPVPDWPREIVRRNITWEVEFYQFCRQRLHRQYLALELGE